MNLHTQFQEIVLCWLATANKNGIPNVSPKEMFLLKKEHQLIIANIRSPKSIMNIFENPKVCVSGINIFKQKGIQCKGEAKVLSPQDFKFKQLENDFRFLNKGRFRIQHFILVNIQEVKKMNAPSYFYYPNTKQNEQVEAAKKCYLLRSFND